MSISAPPVIPEPASGQDACASALQAFDRALRATCERHALIASHQLEAYTLPPTEVDGNYNQAVLDFDTTIFQARKQLQKYVSQHESSSLSRVSVRGGARALSGAQGKVNFLYKSSQQYLDHLARIDEVLDQYHRLFTQALDEKTAMGHMCTSSQEVINSLERRIEANKDLFEAQLATNHAKFQAHSDILASMEEELEATRRERDAKVREVMRLQKDLQVLSFTVKQMKNAHHKALTGQLRKPSTSEIGIQCEADKDAFLQLAAESSEVSSKEDNRLSSSMKRYKR